MIFDCHAHVASTRVLPPRFFEGWAENVTRLLQLPDEELGATNELLLSAVRDDQCDALIQQMDQARIDRAILLVIDFAFAFPELDVDIVELHRRHAAIAARTQRFEVFAGVDPRRGIAGVDLLETALRDWGFSGFKIYPPCGYSPADAQLDPYFEVCRAYGVPVLTHVGPTSAALGFETATPLQVDRPAARFPSVNFILAHAGTMWHEDAALLAQYRPNVYLDLSGFQSELDNGHFAGKFRWLLERGLHHKLLFGTDWPIHRLFGTQQRWVTSFLDLCRALHVPHELEQAMLSGNCERLLAKKPMQSSKPEARHARA